MHAGTGPRDELAKSIFLDALEIGFGEDRLAYLDRSCGADAELRAEIETLLRHHAGLGDYLEQPALGPPATLDFAVRPAAEGPGTVIGPYKLLQAIGEGGMGTVYMAEQEHPVRRRVALKLIRPGMDSRQVIARFEAERQALALMDHPNIARVLDAGATPEGRPYFVMELVKGVPITRYCDEQRLTPRQRLELFIPVCQAVQHAHQKGIIHRDIKPSNVLIALYDGEPVPKVIDFGVAKATGPRLTERTLYTEFGSVVGTLEYMSPEQADPNNQDIDTRSDIYALGVLLYELLTGTTPISHERLTQAAFTEMLRAIREEEPPKPSTRLSDSKETLPSIAAQRQTEPARLTKLVRGELDWIVMKALEKDRNRRYETANGLARDIESYLHDEPVQACPPSAWYRLGKFVRRNKQALAMAGLVLFVLVLVGAVGGWVLRDRAARRQETATQARESLNRARQWSRDNKLTLAREELAAAKARMGSDRAALRGLAAEVESYDSELGRLERFLGLVEQAHEAEFPPPVPSAVQAGSAGGTAAPALASNPTRESAKAVPSLLQALSCYGVLERDDWSTRLESGLLDRDQVAQVRRTAYEQLLWLADNVARRQVDHRSGRKVSQQEAAEQGVAYLRQAEAAARPTSAFYQVRARCLNSLGKPAEARRDEELAQQTPGAIALDHYLLAAAAYYAKDKAEAVKQSEAALRVEPTHYWSLLGLGDSLGNLGKNEQDFALAAIAYSGCILKRPDHAPAYVGRGNAYVNLGRRKEGVADFREALRLRPDDPVPHHNLGSALFEQGKYAEAEAEAREVLRLRPDYPLARQALGAALEKQGKRAEAQAQYRQTLRFRPDSPEGHNNLGVTLANQGKHAEAEAEYREALRLRPNYPLARNNLGNALMNQSKYAQAEAEYREALRLRPDYPEAHNGLGWALNDQGKHPEAEAECREALRLWPDFTYAHENLGDALGKQGKLAEAEAEYREAIRLQPDYLRAYGLMGNVLIRQGKPAAAARLCAEAIAAHPKLADPSDSALYNGACGAALAGCGQGQDAAKLDDAERARLRHQALDWLRADLTAWGQLLEKQPDQTRTRVQEKLRFWQQDSDFNGVRGAALAKLPEAERQAWQQLWKDVEQMLKRVSH